MRNSLDRWKYWSYLLGKVLVLTVVCASGLLAQSSVRPPASPLARTSVPVPGTPAGVTAFVDVAVVPMDTERVLPGQTVLVEGGRITTLGPTKTVRVPAGAAQVDGRGKFLIPGLADMHVHFRDARDSLQLQFWLFRWLSDGITTLRNMDRHNEEQGAMALHLKSQAAAGQLPSPRIYTAGPWGPREYRLSGIPDPDRRSPDQLPLDSIAGYIAAYQAAEYDFIKPYHESPIVLDSLMAVARRQGMPIGGHVPVREGGKLEDALAGGYASIEHLWGYTHAIRSGMTMAQLADATRRAGVWNCPTIAIHLNFWDTTTVAGKQLFNALLQQANMLHHAGAGLLLGTDDGAPLARDNPDQHGMVHTELQVLIKAGLTPYEALVTGTRNVATFFGTLDETGTIEVGKRADLVLLRGNPLADLRHTIAPAGVMIGGRWFPRETLDRRLTELRAEHDRRLAEKQVENERRRAKSRAAKADAQTSRTDKPLSPREPNAGGS